MNSILTCNNLSKSFGNKKALNNVTLNIERGRIVGLLGPNSSGKSTFIKLCNDLLTPTSGELQIAGNAPGIEDEKRCFLFT